MIELKQRKAWTSFINKLNNRQDIITENNDQINEITHNFIDYMTKYTRIENDAFQIIITVQNEDGI